MEKTLIAMGGSIVKGTYTAPGQESPMSIAHPNFAELVAEALGYELINYGHNGVCTSPFSGPFQSQATLLKFDTVELGDAFLLMGGTNDYSCNIPIGELKDRTENTFLGAARLLFEKIDAKYPKDKVFVINTALRLNDGANELGLTLDDYRNAFSKIIAEFGFLEIDCKKIDIDPKNPEHREKYVLDGLHPNVAGHRVYADYIISRIKEIEK